MAQTKRSNTVGLSMRGPWAHGATEQADVRELDVDECWRLLGNHDLGRLAVRAETGVDIFPVNYLVHNRALYFRSAPGSKLVGLTRAPQVSFEADGQLAHHVWSVVVHGVAERLASDAEITESAIQTLTAWQPGEKFNYVRITPTTITGRNFAKSAPLVATPPPTNE
jgi:nitroimidazol reductase NimA-like FMN-containing flavoprotein (pyridoxamine 5'-phosphate oxidase superfamily)